MRAPPTSSARSVPFLNRADDLPDVSTPALLVDVDRLQRNIDVMAAHTTAMGIGLRPHAKAHKMTPPARRQLGAGAVGITVATVREAEAMVDAGVASVLVANQTVSATDVDTVVRLSERAEVIVLVDDDDNLDALAVAARRVGREIGVLVELDLGMNRAGVRSIADAIALIQRAVNAPGVAWRGVHGYEGHCSDEPDRQVRAAATGLALDRLAELVQRAGRLGLAADIVSAGSTGTYDTSGAHEVVTEIQPGSYVLMDGFHAPLIDDFEFALGVLTTAISVQGTLTVFDAGRKGVSGELSMPLPPPGAELAFLNEEHIGFEFPHGHRFRVGDRTALVPGYAPLAVNLYTACLAFDSAGVVDRWRICGRHGS